VSPARTDFATLIGLERERTQARIEAYRRTFVDIVESAALSPPDDEHDPEGATIAFERAQVAALLSNAEQHLLHLDAALARIEDGSFGTCDQCGLPIPEERLAARPATTTCVRCASGSN
jgi:RNA polymerase-binding transcription factor DksA